MDDSRLLNLSEATLHDDAHYITVPFAPLIWGWDYIELRKQITVLHV